MRRSRVTPDGLLSAICRSVSTLLSRGSGVVGVRARSAPNASPVICQIACPLHRDLFNRSMGSNNLFLAIYSASHGSFGKQYLLIRQEDLRTTRKN